VRALDRYLRERRIAKAERFVNQGDVVIDVGCADGAMFERWSGLIEFGYGVDPILDGTREASGYRLVGGRFPEALPGVKADVITMLAVIEHIPPDAQAGLAEACDELLNPGGRVVVTVPSPRVDDILAVLRRLRLIDGMSLEEHYGFDPRQVPALFPTPRFRLLAEERFQLTLNNLFVFEKPATV
jgi:SAM-dependent methyltransferase